MLEVRALECSYGRIPALKGVNLELRVGELVALVGGNGAGKTTLLRALSGVQRVSAGEVVFEGKDITRAPSDVRVRRGIVQVPEGRLVFAPLSVEDNLRLGGYTRSRNESEASLERVFEMFPVLKSRRRQPAGTLSGGEAQRVKLSRELSKRDTGRTLYLLDEPTTGLHFADIQKLLEVLNHLVDLNNTVVVIEHNLDVIKTADWVIDLGPEGGEDGGRVVVTGTPEAIVACAVSHTGRHLARVLAASRSHVYAGGE